jgi:hypothetical protein
MKRLIKAAFPMSEKDQFSINGVGIAEYPSEICKKP